MWLHGVDIQQLTVGNACLSVLSRLTVEDRRNSGREMAALQRHCRCQSQTGTPYLHKRQHLDLSLSFSLSHSHSLSSILSFSLFPSLGASTGSASSFLFYLGLTLYSVAKYDVLSPGGYAQHRLPLPFLTHSARALLLAVASDS